MLRERCAPLRQESGGAEGQLEQRGSAYQEWCGIAQCAGKVVLRRTGQRRLRRAAERVALQQALISKHSLLPCSCTPKSGVMRRLLLQDMEGSSCTAHITCLLRTHPFPAGAHCQRWMFDTLAHRDLCRRDPDFVHQRRQQHAVCRVALQHLVDVNCAGIRCCWDHIMCGSGDRQQHSACRAALHRVAVNSAGVRKCAM